MLKEERAEANLLIAQHSTGMFGVNEEYLKKADAVEIKIGQGAKPGQGGLLPSYKLTEEIMKVRGVSSREDIHSPAYHLDIKNISELKEKVSWLRDIVDNKPIIIKIGAGNIIKDMELAIKAEPDIIAIDGFGGGTGAAPEVMLDDLGIPIIPALVKARKKLNEYESEIDLIVGGGISKGSDFAKMLALGADAVFLGFPILVAMGCTYCKMCYLGKCPKGIATQDEELRKKLDIEKASTNIVNYLKVSNEEIKMIAGAVGKNNVHDLDIEDLRTFSAELSKITNVKIIGVK